MSLTCALILNLLLASSSSKVGPTSCPSAGCGTSMMQDEDHVQFLTDMDDVHFLQASVDISSGELENRQSRIRLLKSQLAEERRNEFRSQTLTKNSTTPFYHGSDISRLTTARHHSKFSRKSMPRVLLYTWCTPDYLERYFNEVYWKSCYAHAHGFDVVFSSAKNATGVRKMNTSDGSDSDVEKGYVDEMMWAWVNDIGKYLFSGWYDYVFYIAGDVLINSANLHFPVWAYDKGHDITIMDQSESSWGLNSNGVLFKPSHLTRKFLDEFFEFRKDFYLQGDNGLYMEMLLRFIGRGAESQGKPGYENKCEPLCKLNESSASMFAKESGRYFELNNQYSMCFFGELERLAGKFQQRESDIIGFSKTFLDSQGKDIRNLESAHGDEGSSSLDPKLATSNSKLCENIPQTELPWANCFSDVRNSWPNWKCHCFALHWNGQKSPGQSSKRMGTCPDPTFNFAGSPYELVGMDDRIAERRVSDSPR